MEWENILHALPTQRIAGSGNLIDNPSENN